MATRVIQPDSSRPVLKEDGSLGVQLNAWVSIITNQALVIGSGSPETVVGAIQGTTYMDTAGTTGSILYIKRDGDISGDTTKGWLLI